MSVDSGPGGTVEQLIADQLLDLTVVDDFMTAQGLPPGPLTDVTVLTGGTQNILVRFRRGDTEYVLRRPPAHLRERSNANLMREARVLRALNDEPVPTPRLIAACADPQLMRGAVFFLMTAVDGYNLGSLGSDETGSDDGGLAPAGLGYRFDLGAKHALGISAAAAVAALGTIDPAAVGLADFGRPDGFLERQVPRWLSELDGYRAVPGYDGPHLPDVDGVARWLIEHCPPQGRPGILHGDYHLANVLFRTDRPAVSAIVDWEMSTIGDPLLDLGWLLATMPDADGKQAAPIPVPATGLPTAAEFVAAYAAHSDRDLTSIDWYTVLACFKLGIILEGTHARAAAGMAPVDVGDALHRCAVALFDRAGVVIAGGLS